MKRITLFLVFIFVLVGCGANELSGLNDEISNLDGDHVTAKNTLKNMKYLDEVLLNGNDDYEFPKLSDSKPNGTVEADLFTKVFSVTATAKKVNIAILDFEAGNITQEDLDTKLEEFKTSYKENRDTYIKQINEYIESAKGGNENE